MPAMRIGIRLESLGLPLREAIEMAARLGAKGVQFDAVDELAADQLSQTGRRHLRHLITSHALQISAIGFPTRRGYDSLDKLEARVNQTAKTLLMAHEMGAPMVINHIGAIPEKRDDPKTRHFFESMDRIGAEAERVGSRFAIETGLDSPQRLATFLKEMNRFGLAINYDAANLLAQGHEIYEGVRLLADSIIGVHVKDVARSGSSIAGFKEASVGEGSIDWELLLGAFEEIGYHGYFTIERETNDRRVDEIRKAMEYLTRF